MTRPLPWRLERSRATSQAASSSSVAHRGLPLGDADRGRDALALVLQRGHGPQALERPRRRGGGARPARRWAGSRRTRRRRSARRGRRRGTRPPAPARRPRSIASPAWWPWRSLTSLKSSRSISRHESGPPVRIARPISSSRRRRMARWFMQPVTGSVPASARARTSASAVAAWSTSVAASSIERSSKTTGRRRTSITTASTSPRSASGSSSAQLVWPVAVSRGTLAASSSSSAARKLLAGPSDPAHPRRALGARQQVAEAPVAVEQVHGHQILVLGRERPRWWMCTSSAPGTDSSSRASARKIVLRVAASRRPAASAAGCPPSSASTPAGDA